MEAFRGIKKVEIATYEVESSSESLFPRRLQQSFERQGWETLATFREEGEFAWITYRIDNERLKNVLVVALDDTELTLLRLGGRLDKVLRAALSYSNQQIVAGNGKRRETLVTARAADSEELSTSEEESAQLDQLARVQR